MCAYWQEHRKQREKVPRKKTIEMFKKCNSMLRTIVVFTYKMSPFYYVTVGHGSISYEIWSQELRFNFDQVFMILLHNYI